MSVPGVGGETVGDAYIRILADGSRLPHSIREEWRKSDPVIKGEGRRGSKLYQEEFAKEMESRPGRVKMQRAVARALAQGDITQDFFKDGSAFDKFRRSLEFRFGEAGRRAGKNLADGLAQGGGFDSFKRRIQNLNHEISVATRQIRDEEQRALVATRRNYKERITLATALERRLAALTRGRHDIFGTEETKTLESRFAKLITQIRDEGTSAESASRKMRVLLRAEEEMKKVTDDLESGFFRVDRRLRNIGKEGNVFRNTIRQVSDLERRLGNVDKKVRNLKIGRFFGEGSRNDFFNILGKITGRLAEFSLLAGVRATRALVGFGSGFRQADGAAGKFTFTMRILDGVMGKLITGGLGVGAALSAIQLIAGPLAALISTLAGAVTALASTIVVGLIGGIGALLPVMGAMGIGLGVVALAFAKGGKTAADWKKEITKALGPVTSQFHNLQDAARKGLFPELNKDAPLLAKTLSRLDPLVTKVGHSLGVAVGGFLKNLQGPQFKKNLDAMEKFIPHAIISLGKVVTNVFGGIAGLMRAMVPIADRLLASWVKGSAAFRAFANSPSGQNKLTVWFENAYDAGRRLWRFTKDLIKVLFDLLDLGTGTGDNIFDSMNKSLEKFDAWLRSDRGRLAVHQWLDDSRQMLTHLGNFVAGVAHLFGRLSGGGTGTLNAILDGLGKFADLLAAALPTIQNFLHDVGQVMGIFIAGLIDVFHFVSAHHDLFQPLIVSLAGLWAAWKLFTIGSALASGFTTIIGALTLGFANMIATITRGTSQLETSKQRLSVVMAGLGVALTGITAGSQISGLGGAAIGIGGGALGGAIAGSAFGPEGTAIGAVIGGVAGAITHFWGEANRSAEEAKSRQLAVIAAIQAAAGELRTTLAQDADSIGHLTKVQIAAQLGTEPKGGGPSALAAAQAIGLDPHSLVLAAAGNRFNIEAIQSFFQRTLFNLGHQAQVIAGSKTPFSAKDLRALAGGDTGLGDAAATARLKQLQPFLKLLFQVKDALGFENRAVVKAIKSHDLLAQGAGGLNLATRDLATQTKAYGHTLREQTIDGQRNQQWIKDHVHLLGRQAKAMVDAKKPALDIAQAYLTGARNLRQNLHDADFADHKTRELIATFGQVPKSVLTKLLGDDSDATKKIVRTLGKLGLIPKSWLTRLLGKDEASSIFENVHHNLNQVPSVKKITITAVKAPTFDFTIQHLVNQVTGTVINIPVGVRPAKGQGVTATGGIFGGRQSRIIAEAGPEAVVPLRRPLSQVDPSVRWLSAIAQGLDPDKGARMAAGGVVHPNRQKIINVEAGAISIIAPLTDPVAAATMVLDHAATIGGYAD